MNRMTNVSSAPLNRTPAKLLYAVGTVAIACLLLLGMASPTGAQSPAKPRAFTTAEEAAEALVAAAETFDEAALKEILGPDSYDIVHTGEPARDKEVAAEFASLARTKKDIAVDPRNPRRAILEIGEDGWPFPVPIAKQGGKWFFDTKAGRHELLYRRVGRNELDAIQVCRGFVEAQHEYALKPREGYEVNQYAQLIISSPGKQDGLAWQNPDGAWGGPIGEKAARAIERGYQKGEPYHGYFFKVLKGQGPAAPLGKMDFVVKDVMIGGFALLAFPAQYRVTGVKSFMVSHDGVVYEKDLGPNTLKIAKGIERFNPDKTWSPAEEEEQPQ